MTEGLALFAFMGHGDVMVFSIAIAVVLIIGLLEGLGAVIGFAFSSMLDNLLPDLSIDAEAPDINTGVFSEFLTWLRIRGVPAIIILMAFLMGFGSIGLVSQLAANDVLGTPVYWQIAVPCAVFLAIPSLRIFVGLMSAIMPRDETSAVSRDTFIGRMATITLGTARKGSAAEARLTDRHGQTHYVMVEPDLGPSDPDQAFAQGETVLLTRQNGSRFMAIATNTNTD